MLGFSYGVDGWNYLIEFLREFDHNPDIERTDTILHRFYELYQPDSSFNLVEYLNQEITFRPPFGIYPWGTFSHDYSQTGSLPKNSLASRHVGPSDSTKTKTHILAFLELYQNLKSNGYQPWKYNRSFIGGTWLNKKDGRKRYIVLQGNHRAAILAHLGYNDFLARRVKGRYYQINETDVETWYYVKNGRCPINDALAYFDAFFEMSGIERAQKIGLL